MMRSGSLRDGYWTLDGINVIYIAIVPQSQTTVYKQATNDSVRYSAGPSAECGYLL